MLGSNPGVTCWAVPVKSFRLQGTKLPHLLIESLPGFVKLIANLSGVFDILLPVSL